MFNPGCPEAACCDEEESNCPDVCITVNNPDGTPASGVTVDGHDLGTQVTGSDGRVCFAIDGPGQYAFDTTRTGDNPGGIEVDVTEEECSGSGTTTPKEEETITYPTTRPAWCRDYRVTSCNCPMIGITFDFVTANGYSVTLVSDRDGRVRICIPLAYQANGVNWTLTVSGPDFVTQVTTGTYYFVAPFQGAISLGIVMVDEDERYCFRRIPGGFGTQECIEYYPPSVTVTIGGAWFGGISGQTVTCFQLAAPLNQYSSGCLANPDGLGGAYVVTVTVNHSGPCGQKPASTINIRFLFNGFPACTTSADDASYSGTSNMEPGGTGGCPVAYYTGFERNDIGDFEPYSTTRWATVSE